MLMNRVGNAGSRAALLLGVSLGAMLMTTPALAQDQTVPDPAEQPTSEDTVQNQEGENTPEGSTTETDDSAIVVTGSRIRQPEFTSPDPVALIDPETAQREGKNDTASMLQSSPIAAGSTQITSALSSNFVTNGGPGAETLDLRGLGANRTLVLLNGRRAGPAGTRGAVSSFDLNVLPQSIVSRVDVLKTGASSIYGSDAIAGVVNLITKTELDGFQLDGNASVPFDSGGENYRISGLWGKTFGRGHVMVAVDYYKRQELARSDRRYLDCPEAYTFRPDGSRADLIDPRTGQYKCEDLRWGHVWTYDVEYIYGYPGNMFLANGTNVSAITGGTVLMQYQYPGETLGIPPIVSPPGAFTQFRAPAGWVPTGYDTQSLAVQNSFHPFVLDQTIVPETERKTFYADAAYEVTDGIELFGEFLFNRRETYQNGWRQFWNFGFTGDFYNAYYQYSTGDPAAEGWEGWNWLSATGITDQSDTSQRVDYYRGVAGLRGDFGGFLKNFSWDAHVQYSKSDGRYRTQQILQDAVYNLSYFQTTPCAETTGPWGPVTPISNKQCLDLPWYDPFFLRGEMTQQQLDYMFEWEEGRTKYTQLNGEVSLAGKLFELPAGPLGLAVGVTARRDRIRDVPGHITMSVNPFFDPTIDPNASICNRPTAARRTLPCEPIVSNAWGSSSSTITAGKSDTTEAFGEIQVPIFRGQPFFKDLSFSGAARLTNVKSTRDDGVTDKDTGNWTYKLGGNWAVNDWLRFRATYGTSFRAPALFEQFLGEEKSFISQRAIDPCIRWAANLAAGNITQQIADNCAADGVPPTHPGGGITAEVIGIGGIGSLDPETSTAKTASIILTPRFSFLPDTAVSLAVDYFDIEVKGEISRLGAGAIVSGCYSSENFPNDPLCALFQRGQVLTAPFNISSVQDRFINIASQRNKGLDFTGNVRHNFGGWMGTLNFLGNVTYQLKDDIEFFAGFPESDNGEAGSPKFVGDFNLTWRPRGGWSIFYGIDVFGKTDDTEDLLEDIGGDDNCIDSALRGTYCLDVKVPTTFYHAMSVTKELSDRFEFTVGMSNIFDTRPPRVSVVGNNVIPMIGPVVGTSQYDFYGRRMFVNVSRRF